MEFGRRVFRFEMKIYLYNRDVSQIVFSKFQFHISCVSLIILVFLLIVSYIILLSNCSPMALMSTTNLKPKSIIYVYKIIEDTNRNVAFEVYTLYLYRN